MVFASAKTLGKANTPNPYPILCTDKLNQEPSMQWWLTIASIRLAVVCMAVWFTMRICLRPNKEINIHQPPAERVSTREYWAWVDWIWVAGSLFSLIHMVAVFTYIHQWSHQLAVDDTARQTESFLGVAVGIGVYFNYAFVAIWLLDAAWLLLFSQSYWRRSKWISRTIYGYLLFIAFNGAVVFVSGWFRWFSAALFALMLLSWILLMNRSGIERTSNPNPSTE